MIVHSAIQERESLLWRGGSPVPSSRPVAEEKAIALTYCGSTYAVMMATPSNLEDFGVGFSITEGIVRKPSEISSIELIERDIGFEIRMWLEPERAKSIAARRRAIVGPVGCGLCGIESLEQARAEPRRVESRSRFRAQDLVDAICALPPLQYLNRKTRAMHAAAFWNKSEGISPVREDVGRHNALDKLAGALIGRGASCENGAVLLTSRVSVEMVQKAATIGVPLLIAVSAPTTLAIETAELAGITLVAVARNDGYEIFTHPDRIISLNGQRLA